MSFQDSGCRIFPRLLSVARGEAFRIVLTELLARLAPDDPAWDHVVPVSVLKESRNPGVPSVMMEEVPFIIGQLPQVSPDFLPLLLDEGLWQAASDVLQTDDVVYHFSNVTRKPARVGPNMSWHRDYPNEYMCPEDARDFFRALIPLEGMDRQNGCTEVIPGTHRVSDTFAQEALRDRIVDYDIADAIPLEASLGDVIAIDSKVVHGGRENRSTNDRNLVVVQFGRRTDRFLWKCEELYSGQTRTEILRDLASSREIFPSAPPYPGFPA